MGEIVGNKILEYIGKQETPQREICQRLRNLVLATFPEIKEGMKWGVPAFAEGMFYIVALKDHVNLGFSVKGLSLEELTRFDGGGKTMKVVEITTLNEIDEGRILMLLKLVSGKANATRSRSSAVRKMPKGGNAHRGT